MSQTIVSPAPTSKVLDKVSRSESADMIVWFSASPIYVGEVTDASQKKEMQDVLDEEINDGGHTFGTFDPDYPDAPNLQQVNVGGKGLPVTPYVPNLTSPGPGSINPADQKSITDEEVLKALNIMGPKPANPSLTSKRIAGATLGDYILGKSNS